MELNNNNSQRNLSKDTEELNVLSHNPNNNINSKVSYLISKNYLTLKDFTNVLENQGYIEFAEIISTNFDINIRNKEGQALIHFLTYFGKNDLILQCLNLGADIDSVDNKGGYGYTILHIAANFNNFNLVKILLSMGANPNIRATGSGEKPSDIARKYGYTRLAIFIEESPNFNNSLF